MALLNKDAYNPAILKILNQGLHHELFDPFAEYQPEVDVYQLLRRSGLTLQKIGTEDSNNWFDGKTGTITIPANRSFEEDYIKIVRLIVAVGYMNTLPENYKEDPNLLNRKIDLMTLDILTPHGVVLSQFLQQTKTLNLAPNPSAANKPEYRVIIQYLAHVFHASEPQIIASIQHDPYDLLQALEG